MNDSTKDKPPGGDERLSRREFVKTGMAASLALTVGGGLMAAEETSTGRGATAPTQKPETTDKRSLAMNIEKTSFGPWSDAYRLTIGKAEMIVAAQVGPRIMSLKVGGGPNVLLDDSKGTMARGEWHTWGGHRFWIAPETEATYCPDNAPCKVDQGKDRLTLSTRPDPSGLEKTIEVAPCAEHGGFIVRHILRNKGDMLATGAVWCLTCVVPKGRIIAPWGEGNAAWTSQMIRYWRQWAGHHSNIESPQWKQKQEYFSIEPTGEEGKVGLFNQAGFVALLRDDATFVKGFQPIAGATYPDGGCNLEMYTCEKFVEMETLSPLQTFLPGTEFVHEEHWLITDQVFKPEDWRKVGALMKKA